MPKGLAKALRIIGGIVAMAAVVATLLAILVRYAGGWGVPYFSFVTDRGSSCTNRLAGYVCSPITVADVEYYSDLDLPEGTAVTSGTYVSTHDYRLDAVLEVPAAGAEDALATLQDSFGKCIKGHPSPLPAGKLAELCVMSNDNAIVTEGEAESRLYVVGTGLHPNGSRQIALNIRSR